MGTGLSALTPLGRAAAPRKLKIGLIKLVSTGPIFIAYDKGYFKDQELELEIIPFEASQPIAAAAASGAIDVGFTAFTAGLYNLAGSGALKVIAGGAAETPGYPLPAYLACT